MRRLILASLLLATPALADSKLDLAAGQKLYAENCAVCHQPDGTGAPGSVPPLKQTLKFYLDSAPGKQYLAQILVTGMAGPIDTTNGHYTGVMPPFGRLDDASLANLIGYALVKFNGVKAGDAPIKASEIAAARTGGGTAASARQLRTQAKDAAGQK
jgi:mono/diheme cytochrome c family protein